MSFAGGEALVEFDAATVSLRDVVDAVRRAGYDVYREEVVMVVDGLDTPSDELVLESRLSRLPGVIDVRAFHASKRLVASYNPLATVPDAVREAVELLGYRVIEVRVE